ncbi:MAG: formate-dependent phosphoribosylglycinamide formyltransferase [Methanosarcinaceae archaeon]|jgi:phosphoribosylglycinamide formyltransferase 2|nr:formate-dependent phosphoribosylglycinamide formyltransferase [Methanosarcinaceae archaeon]
MVLKTPIQKIENYPLLNNFTNYMQLKNSLKILLLGSGELGKEIVIEAQRLGIECIAVDKYQNAPAMQVAHRSHVIDMKDKDKLSAIINQENPDYIIPEIEAINTEVLKEAELNGMNVVPSAFAVQVAMDREQIRKLATNLNLKTVKYNFASTIEELNNVSGEIGVPCVIKPIMSSSGKGQSIVKDKKDLQYAWDYAQKNTRGIANTVIIEEFIDFDYEITLLTARSCDGIKFCKPIGHKQKDGDYFVSWQPHIMNKKVLKNAKFIAKKIVDKLGGFGIYGVELFIREDEVIFNEVSPRPHDTGMVTMVTQEMNEFEIHLRCILGLSISTKLVAHGASYAIQSKIEISNPSYDIKKALEVSNTKIRLFGKPFAKKGRRMGVVLATSDGIEDAISKAEECESLVDIF